MDDAFWVAARDEAVDVEDDPSFPENNQGLAEDLVRITTTEEFPDGRTRTTTRLSPLCGLLTLNLRTRRPAGTYVFGERSDDLDDDQEPYPPWDQTQMTNVGATEEPWAEYHRNPDHTEFGMLNKWLQPENRVMCNEYGYDIRGANAFTVYPTTVPWHTPRATWQDTMMPNFVPEDEGGVYRTPVLTPPSGHQQSERHRERPPSPRAMSAFGGHAPRHPATRSTLRPAMRPASANRTRAYHSPLPYSGAQHNFVQTTQESAPFGRRWRGRSPSPQGLDTHSPIQRPRTAPEAPRSRRRLLPPE